ncbi:hypothetical protein CONPUDRAFT_152668 [Coniophora puteana RWD-64-598 SS2]|uniref:Uncharacterized protein n=1 Tax=Coniophora puteana (strain RWD-64-598) TaxID=741705 RepID=A0A5M3MSQ1_CONPW|nr:uncharacterized protein CONPUDRAFT_152668 [Coniophora puteana RWD-64-598 SS2]EIW81764.1 hypothetical protein CONPUDRAFT_152668 [Coniophora puteana RWD-64-598 SS2]
MSLNASWAPVNATSSELWGQRALIDGMMISSVGYGINVTLFFQCFNILVSRHRKSRTDWFHLVYICLLFTMATLGNAINTKWCEMMFVDDINFPGGPVAFNSEESGYLMNLVGNCVYIINLWFQDGLLLYRFYIIYRRNIYITALPVLTFLVSIVLGCLLMALIADPTNNFYAGFASHLAIIYWSLSIAYNAVLTLAITGRLMCMRWKIKRLLNSRVYTPYVSVSAMLIESAALYTINGLIFVIGFGLNSNLQNLVMELLGQTQSIAPLMIIYRVLKGQAWTNETLKTFGSSGSTTLGTDMQLVARGSSINRSKTEMSSNTGDRDSVKHNNGTLSVNISQQTVIASDVQV